jgi:two-component system nitrogen regulation sensor histidine kinase GlnL
MNLTFDDILFSLPFPAVLLNPSGEIVYTNQKFESLVNRSFKYLRGKALREIFHCSDLDSALKKAFKNTIEVHGINCGRFSFFVSPLFSLSQKVGLLVLINELNSPFEEDITLFLKGLSHEIRNPLSGIKGASELLLRLKFYDEELIKTIISEVKRIESLLSNILNAFNFSHLNFKKENFNKVIKEVCDSFLPVLKTEEVNLKLLFDPSLPEIPLDSVRFKQAFFNLLKNSFESLKESPKKEIYVETGYAIRPSGFVYVKISDTGCGMDEETLKGYGTPFFTQFLKLHLAQLLKI